MDYYGSMRHDYIQKQMYPTENRMDYFPKGSLAGSNVKIVPKPECIPRFVSKIEGNAVEEGDRVFFEGIIDAQPMPGKIRLINCISSRRVCLEKTRRVSRLKA